MQNCCKTVVDREAIVGLKGNSGNQGTTINPLIFKSKPESQTENKKLYKSRGYERERE